jgi:hypothetical protein
MKLTSDQISGIFTAVGIAIFFTVKFWNTNVLLSLDNFYIRLVLILALLASISYGTLPGMVVLAAFIMMFYERNQRKMDVITQMTGGGAEHGDETAALKMIDGDETSPSSPSIYIANDDTVTYETVEYLPKASQQTNEFSGPSREIHETVPLGTAANKIWGEAAASYGF